MNIILQYCLVIIVIEVSTFNLYSQGYIVPDGITYAGYTTGFGADIHILQNPTNGDFTGFTLPPQNEQTFLYNPVLDGGVRTFIVSANDPISLQPIIMGRYTEMTYPNTYVFSVGETFYLGFYTGFAIPQNGDNKDAMFGWGEFANINGTITMLDSALEYGGGGIVAGTQTILPVPESGTMVLTFLGGLLLVWSRRVL